MLPGAEDEEEAQHAADDEVRHRTEPVGDKLDGSGEEERGRPDERGEEGVGKDEGEDPLELEGRGRGEEAQEPVAGFVSLRVN